MYVIGITGNIGSGKSFVGSLLERKGYTVIYIDKVAREVIGKNKNELCKKFPELVVNNQFSRMKLREIFFNREINAEKIEKILHFKIFKYAIYLVLKESLKCKTVVFLEVPLFFEYNLNVLFDSILVYCDKNTQMRRIYSRDGEYMSEQKLKFFKNHDSKMKKATFLINNSKSKTETLLQLDKLKFEGHTIYFYVFLLMALACLISTLYNFYMRK